MVDQASLLISSLEGASKDWASFDWSGKAKQWEVTTSQNKEAREQSLTARKSLSETTKQFKRSVKSVEQAGSSLEKSGSPENSTTAVKAIESVAKNCRLIVKAYQGSFLHSYCYIAPFLNFLTEPCSDRGDRQFD